MGLFDQADETPRPPDDKNRLFETQQEITGFNRHYLKLLLIVAAFVFAAGAVIYYFTLPGRGDVVRGSKELEDSVRAHFLGKVKRTATDVKFYYCVDYYAVKVDVETRYDIPGNPLAKVPTYWAKAVPAGDDRWEISVPADQAAVSESDPCSMP